MGQYQIYITAHSKMQNKALAQLVLQKIRQKKEQQLRNTPHYKILQLQTVFEFERNALIKHQLSQLQNTLANLEHNLTILEGQAQQLDLTGKRNFPRIIVKPEFIASEKLEPKLKEFYRKLANTFLRLEVIRRKKAERSEQICSSLNSGWDRVSVLEKQLWSNREEKRKEINAKRRKLLNQKLRLQDLNQQIQQLRQTIRNEREQKIDLVREFELKQGGLASRKSRLVEVQQQIQLYKRKLEEQFTPAVYREHLAKVYALQAKNQIILHNITLINAQISHHNSLNNSTHSRHLPKSRQMSSARRRDSKLRTEPSMDWNIEKSVKSGGLCKITTKQSSPVKGRLRSEDSQFFVSHRSTFLKQ